MARIRSVKPEFFDDYEFVTSTSRDERLFFQGLWVQCCDDHGIFLDAPRYLKNEIFPYDDDISTNDVEKMVEHLAEIGCLHRYEAGGKEYALVVHFLDHQKIDRPNRSRLHPEPPGSEFDMNNWKWVSIPTEKFDDESLNPRGTFDQSSTNPRRLIALEGRGKERIGKDQERRGGEDETSPRLPENPPELLKTFELKVGRPISSKELEWLSEAEGIHGAALVEEAITIAKERKKLRPNYITGILQSWAEQGLRTVEDVRLSEGRAGPGGKPPPDPEKQKKKEIVKSLYCN